jgi:uncharacterized membrane protein
MLFEKIQEDNHNLLVHQKHLKTFTPKNNAMKTKPFAIALVLLCTVLTSIGQIFLKKGSSSISFDFLALITNGELAIGLVLYAVAAILLIAALKNGELSIIYPFIATSYIWVSLLSVQLLSETMNTLSWAGIALIIIGVSCIGRGAK